MKYQFHAGRIIVVLWAALASAMGQSIVSFNPTYGQPGSPVTINGYNLNNKTVVRFGAAVASATLTGTVGGVQQMQATVPAGLSGAVLISLQNSGGPLVYSSSNFMAIGSGPYINDFSPSGGGPGTPVTINGANFAGATSVKFGTLAATFNATIVNKITATAPNGVVTGPITVTTPKGSYTTPDNFFAPPAITSFAPASGRVGSSVKIAGQNFLGALQVNFGNIPAASFNVDNNTQITAVVPDGVTNALISVVSAANTAFSATKFAVLPVVFGFSPTVGQSGTPVTITGSALNAGAPTVSFGGSAPVAVSSASYSQLIVVTPGAARSGPLTITTANGSVTTTNNYLMPPTLFTITPSTGIPGTQVTITGTNFTNAISVKFNGVPASFTNVTAGSLKATVPAGAGSGLVSVITPAGTAISSTYFLVQPQITGFTPLSGVSGTIVTISGSFPDGVTNVFFNQAQASIISTNSTQVRAAVPAAAKTGPITVYAFGGTNASATAFTIDVWLSVAKLNNQGLSISWPTNATGFALQYRTNTAPAAWVTITNPLLRVVGDKNVFTNSATASQRFFRLKK